MVSLQDSITALDYCTSHLESFKKKKKLSSVSNPQAISVFAYFCSEMKNVFQIPIEDCVIYLLTWQ